MCSSDLDATEVERREGSWLVTLSSTTERRILQGRLLVAADGRHSKLARLLGNSTTLAGENHRSCAFAYYENVDPPAKDRSLFMLGDRDMAFLYPLSGRRVLLSAYIAKDIFAATWARGEKLSLLLEFLRQFPGVPSLKEARATSRAFGFSDYPNMMRQPVAEGAAFIGDAAISLDPMSGVGCAFAAVSAQLLVASTAAALLSKSDLSNALNDYSHKFEAYFRPHARGISADSLIARSAAATAAVYRRIAGNERLEHAFMALTGRLISPAQFQRAFLKEIGRAHV